MAGLVDIGLDLGKVVEEGADLLKRFIPDKAEREKMAHDIATMGAKHQHQIDLAQMSVNKQEAAHKSIFVAGWRPAVGWVCVTAMGLNFIFFPLFGPAIIAYTTMDPFVMEWEALAPVLLGILGLGGMRSYEKRNGVAREK